MFIPSRRLEALRVEHAWFGAGERNRTSNLRFTKPLLCRLSYASPLVKSRSNIRPAQYQQAEESVKKGPLVPATSIEFDRWVY